MHSLKIKITDGKNVHLAALSINYVTFEDAKETLRIIMPLLEARSRDLMWESLTFPFEMPNGVKVQQAK